jgi:glycosyltransferase involved in cell wall biosynthesis
MTLVSIVTPSLDQARYLREAIESVLAQSYAPIEHIVVDGGSTDGTADILREYDHVRWVSEPDRGQSHALNKGFALARGEIFGWLNADDAYEASAVTESVAALAETAAALVYADVMRVNDDRVNPRRIRARAEFDLWTELNLGCGIYSPAVFFTRDAYEGVGGLDESLHMTMDYDLWLRIGRRFAARHVDSVWGMQRLHGDAKTLRMDPWRERLAVSRRHGGRVVSPMAVGRYVGQPYLRRIAIRAAGIAYAVAGRRPTTRDQAPPLRLRGGP